MHAISLICSKISELAKCFNTKLALINSPLTEATMTTNILTQKELKSQLHYEPESGVFTRLVSNHYMWKIGTVAGYKRKDGYVHLRINKKLYLAHRLAWMYVYGEFPKFGLDHIDGNPANNSISNLREANQSQNLCNAKLRIDNLSGHKGVTWTHKISKWRAECHFEGKKYQVGYFYNLEDAVKARNSFAKNLHMEFFRA